MNEQDNDEWKVCVRCFTFNHAPYIVDAMNGFTMQKTTFPYVCCIVDDASTDGEQEVIKSYLNEHFDLEDRKVERRKETDDYVLTFARHKSNLNCFFAVLLLKYNHYSIKKSKVPYLAKWLDKTKYIALCEGDDYWTDCGKLLKQVDFLELNHDYSMCFTDVKDFHQAKGEFGKSAIASYNNTLLPQNKKELFYYILLGKCRIQTLTVVFRKAFADTIVKNDVKFMMGDTTRWLDLSQKGPVYYIPEITGVYRIAEGSACRNPKTLLRFRLSMYEMRIYYCNKYGYELPAKIKREYNMQLANICMNSDFVDADALYPFFPMNALQLLCFKQATKHRVLVPIIKLLWSLESRINRYFR